MKTVIFFCVAIFFSTAHANLGILSGDVDKGLQLSSQCAGCHGQNGITTMGMHPNLAGQNVQYLVYQLNSFKSDKRVGHHMNDIAKGLSDQDIQDLASYYSQINICE